jgi:M6 family metalloprotease-like protein
MVFHSMALHTSATVPVPSPQIASALWGLSGTEMARIGVYVHEIAHGFGLTDLYDADDSITGPGSGLGAYCLMSSPWGFDGSQLYPPMMRCGTA